MSVNICPGDKDCEGNDSCDFSWWLGKYNTEEALTDRNTPRRNEIPSAAPSSSCPVLSKRKSRSRPDLDDSD